MFAASASAEDIADSICRSAAVLSQFSHSNSTRGMKHSHRLPASLDPLPPRFLSCLAEFADLFTRPTWPNVLMLLAGVILTPGRRTIAAALRILGRELDPKFCTFHRILKSRRVVVPRRSKPASVTVDCLLPAGRCASGDRAR